MLIPSIKTFTFGEDLGATEMQDGVNAPITYLYSRPIVSAVLSANQSIANGGVFKLVQLAGETIDNDTMHDLVTNNSRITINTAGAYLIGAQLVYATTAVGRREIQVRVNAAGNPASGTILARDVLPAGAYEVSLSFTRIATFGATNHIELFTFQDSGGALNALGGNENTYLWALQIGT